MFKPYIRLLNAGIIRSGVSIIGLLISIFWLHPVWATDGSATPSSYQVYLPVVSSPFTPMIRKMAASLPVDDSCKNCWTRNGLLSLPPEELARIEQKEEEIQVYANELVAKDQFVANLIKSGQINPSDWPTPAQLTSVPPAEAQKMVAGLNAQLAQMVTAAGVAKQTTPYWGANFVNIAELREPNDKLYNNSCGPASIKVALSVRMPVSKIPYIKDIGKWVDQTQMAHRVIGRMV